MAAAAIDLRADGAHDAHEEGNRNVTNRSSTLLAAVRAGSARLGPESVRRALLARLLPGKGDRLLEVGVGSGSSILAAAARAYEGFVAGVEPDALALRHAERRCARLVREGRIALVEGSSADLSIFETASFDKVYGVHVASFWDEPAEHLAEIRRVLRPGGFLLLGQSPSLPEGRASGDGLEAALRETGFRSVHVDNTDAVAWTTAH
jgi:ubiquinone/menaquinone biosynthesis C-methylase UbiE